MVQLCLGQVRDFAEVVLCCPTPTRRSDACTYFVNGEKEDYHGCVFSGHFWEEMTRHSFAPHVPIPLGCLTVFLDPLLVTQNGTRRPMKTTGA